MLAEMEVFSLFPFILRKNYRWGGGEDKEDRERARERGKVGDSQGKEEAPARQ